MKKIVLGSQNRGKLLEIVAILTNVPVQFISLAEFPEAPDVEETGATFQENAELKALTLARHLNEWVLADDSGLEVDALGGAPGVYSARFAGKHGDNTANNQKLLEELNGLDASARTARFRCVIALASPERVLLTVSGKVEGRIAFEPQGEGGFGYDPLFIYPPEGKTFGQLSAEFKNGVSHRAKALKELRPALAGLLL
ncbi:MAG: XTP/dITP diphosphatase [Planctomycetota bacterium]|nr:XTP/dITP diphosphatase [Planctomycetota bacterium]MDA1138876.1 XTP/dITP diphosphatase [Planctomycetota bacterium]